MTLAAGTLRTSSGTALELGELLGRGGEARVHAVRSDGHSAVKLYARADAERARKLAAMIARAPVDPDRKSGHVSIAWPRELVLDDGGKVVGFVMPRIDARRYLPLHQLYHPRSRRSRAPGMNWRYLVRIARNLCGAVAALHDADYVVGDLNESNVLVDDRALVTLVDLDSIQVTSGYRTFRCNVGKAEYTPPELQGRSFRETNRRPSSDRFGLAVLVFLLLMEGNHPFAGVFRGQGEPPGLEENIGARRSPYFGRGPLEPPPAAPPLDLLGPELGGLLRKGLVGPAWRRPDARALKEALARLEEEMVQCDASPNHAYGGHLDACPWCERKILLGSDPYPNGAATSGSPSSYRNGETASRVTPNGALPATGAAPRHSPAGTPPVSGRTGTTPAAEGARSATPWGSPRRAAAGGSARPTTPAIGREARAARWRNGRAEASRGPAPRDPGGQPPAGFRGSWPQFHSSLPLLSLSLLTLLAAPSYLWQAQIRSLLASLTTSVALHYLALVVLALVPSLAVSIGLYRRARRRPEFARALFVLERVARAAVAAGLLSLLASLAAGFLLGRGSVLAGDWLLLPSFWVVAFVVSLRFVGPRRS